MSKLKGEELIRETGVSGLILRTSWLYGPHGENFVKSILKLGKELPEIKVVDDQIGSPTYVMDIAQVILQLIQKHAFNRLELLHFSNHGSISWCDFARKIIDFRQLNCNIKPVSTQVLNQIAERPAYSVLDHSRLTTRYQIEIENWQDSLHKSLKCA